MSNPPSNPLYFRRRRKRGKRKPANHVAYYTRPQGPTHNPAATLEGLKTIANLIQIHQKLSQSQRNVTQFQDSKPLVSGPRFKNVILNSPAFPQINLASQPSASTSEDKQVEEKNETTSVETPENKERSENAQLSVSNDSKKEIFNSINKSVETATPNKKNKKTKVEVQGARFDSFEIDDSPSFINFDDSEVIELNDDESFKGQEISENAVYIRKNTLTLNTYCDFQKKIQQKFAKKMEIKNQENPSSVPKPSLASAQQEPVTVEVSDIPAHSNKSNNELLVGLSADIKSVVQDNTNSNSYNMHYGMTPNNIDEVYDRRLPAGIPRSFLRNQKFGDAIQPQQSFTSSFNKYSQMQNQPLNSPALDSVQKYDQSQVYSPTGVYEDMQNEVAGSESPDTMEAVQKRVSAFQRLGPLTQQKKPKLTINLCLNKEQVVREVVDETKMDIPVHEREDIMNSTNETVMKYLPHWPWRRNVAVLKSVSTRTSKTIMLLEKEQMEEIYENDNALIMVVVSGYPPSWSKEDVMDSLFEHLNDKSFLPFFIEFTTKECKFFVVRSCGSLFKLHSLGLCVRKNNIELYITICSTCLTINHVDFVPRSVLRKLLDLNYDGEGKLDLNAFTLQSDISHFIYFPLYRPFNQSELSKMQCNFCWRLLTELDLSNNRLISLEHFHLQEIVPKLKVLNISNNNLNSVLLLMPFRYLPLQELYIHGNPLCLDYIDSYRYVHVVKTMFSTLKKLDGVQIVPKGELPEFKKNYCTEDAHGIVAKFLEVFFPLIECNRNVKEIYHNNAVMTVSYRRKLRNTSKNIRNLLIKSQNLLDGDVDKIVGLNNIEKLMSKWPTIQHDPTTFTVDVMFHNDFSTILKVSGLFKITSNSLADDEPLLAFCRTIHLKTKNGCQYKIFNEMVYWDDPTNEYGNSAFNTLMIPKKALSLKFETTPDDDSKKRLIHAFMAITQLNESASERCLQSKSWHFQHALELFTKLLKLEDLQSLLS